VESGLATLELLRDQLSGTDGPVFIRAAIDARTRALWHLDVIAAPASAPEGWEPVAWAYDAVTFAAARTSGSELASALDREGTHDLSVGGHGVKLPVLNEQVRWQRKPSRARYESLVLPWPTFVFEPSADSSPGSDQRPAEYLIGDDCPSFWSYAAAFRAFFYGDYSSSPPLQVPSGFGAIRIVDSTTWIDRVHITATSLEVQLGGSQLAGARVELNGDTYRTDARAGESCSVVLPLPDGLPDGAWLYVSRDRQWLDYRAIGQYTEADLTHAGVAIDVPDDPDSEVEALLSLGEGPQVEFKQQLPADTTESKRKVFKTVAAFANGNGGSIVFGVESDEITVRGIEETDLVAERDRLTQLARSIVTPAPEVEVRARELNGKAVLVLVVEPGVNPPYGISLSGGRDSRIEYYVRRGATTYPARPEEIRNAVLATAPSRATVSPWGY
jgi:hypothetical protein